MNHLLLDAFSKNFLKIKHVTFLTMAITLSILEQSAFLNSNTPPLKNHRIRKTAHSLRQDLNNPNFLNASFEILQKLLCKDADKNYLHKKREARKWHIIHQLT
jgi:hypothetical protein